MPRCQNRTVCFPGDITLHQLFDEQTLHIGALKSVPDFNFDPAADTTQQTKLQEETMRQRSSVNYLSSTENEHLRRHRQPETEHRRNDHHESDHRDHAHDHVEPNHFILFMIYNAFVFSAGLAVYYLFFRDKS